jgi:hypothetical protein
VDDNLQQIDLLRLLASRLERLSADSHWARRASGMRGNIIKIIDQFDSSKPVSTKSLETLTDAAFELLRKAAQELPDLEDILKKSRMGS